MNLCRIKKVIWHYNESCDSSIKYKVIILCTRTCLHFIMRCQLSKYNSSEKSLSLLLLLLLLLLQQHPYMNTACQRQPLMTFHIHKECSGWFYIFVDHCVDRGDSIITVIQKNKQKGKVASGKSCSGHILLITCAS